MARFCTLCSSSSGNSTYIGTSSEGILVDAGMNCKQLCLALDRAGLTPESVKAIFITHEHSDHILGMRVFASKFSIPVFASGGTLSYLLTHGHLNEKFRHEIITEKGIAVGDMFVSRFPTSHDAKESCGYRIELPDRTVGIATDTGVFSDAVFNGIRGCDLVLLESNYDSEMLRTGPYDELLKRRIRSETGHLSNDDCADASVRLLESGTTRLVLGHLSRENNTPELAYKWTHSSLKRAGAQEGTDYELSVAEPVNSKRFTVF